MGQVNTTLLAQDGYTPNQIKRIEAYYQLHCALGTVNAQKTIIDTPTGKLRGVCRTIAEAIDREVPGSIVTVDVVDADGNVLYRAQEGE